MITLSSRATLRWGGVAASVLAAVATSWGQEKQSDPAAAMRAAAMPGPVHKRMAKRAGFYNTVSKFRVKPDDPATETIGSSKITSILGGRFLQEESRGKLLGQSTLGFHLEGYNSGTKKYESTWVYTGSTAIMTMAGTSKDDGKTIEYVATFEIAEGTKETLHVLFREIDDDHFVVELIHKNPDGSKGATFETTYGRRRAAAAD